ncbi:hypothetical protein [Litoribacter populi]|uniref:hypothetical protein n=1 Tax=Litoribacter populi TaxID=2598460 RepID=UPI00118115F0|nr:hypothetical protein [Litoribacter populi]
MENPAKEKLAADLILKRGVRLPMRAPFFLRWIGKKEISLRVTAPYDGTLTRVASYYLSTGLQIDDLTDISTEDALAIKVRHGDKLNKAVACAWLNGYWAGKLFTRPLAWYLKWHAKSADIYTIAMVLLIHGGVQDFMITTKSVSLMRITLPNLGHQEKGS